MYRLPSRVLRFLALAMFVGSILPARAQEPVVQSYDFYVPTVDNVSIHVHRKAGAEPKKVPVLLIHGWGGNGETWDFPGRSVMDYLAVRGYDVYALDLRGTGLSDHPTNYFTIDLLDRVNDAAAVAQYIAQKTGRVPVVMGWSQGGVIAGLLAASTPQLAAGVGFLSVAPDGFSIPPDLASQVPAIIASGVDRLLLPPQITFELYFGTDPITGQPTISPDAFDTFVSPRFSEADSLNAVLEAGSPIFFNAYLIPAWPKIRVPALVVDGGLDPLVGKGRAQALFNALGTVNKQLVIFPRNSHGWFLEDNDDATMRVFDRFLSQF
jgi:pimeloyl-ACP methyl ester carboxylesterase